MDCNFPNFKILVADPDAIASPPLQIPFEDEDLIIVFKPHRLPVQGDKTGHPTLFDQICCWLKEQKQTDEDVYLGMVHRLDRPASGLLVFAKTTLAARRLSEQFRERRVGKAYEALVEGKPKALSGRLQNYLSSPSEGPSLVYDSEHPGTKLAELEYLVLESNEHQSLIEIRMLTGRRHQIRAQMASLGCPILGDGRYGSTTPYLPGSIALVAKELRFNHPTNGLGFCSQIPADLSSVQLTWRRQK